MSTANNKNVTAIESNHIDEDIERDAPTDDSPKGNVPIVYTIGRDKIKFCHESFDEMNLKIPLLRGIFMKGLEKPSVIQKHAIGTVLSGTDTIAQSQSGTGKTATFGISILQSIDETQNNTQALILAPTHELAEQIYDNVITLGKKMKNLSVCKTVGGSSMRDNMDMLRRNPQIVVGTPGRVYDMIQRGALYSNKIKIFCLDEADQMLDRGFKPQVKQIFSRLPNEVQTILFSATMPREVQEITKQFMRQPATHLLLPQEEVPLEGINQFYVRLDEDHKLATLLDLYGDITITQCLIFCNTTRKIEWLQTQLESKGYPIISMHGKMSNKERDEQLQLFRSGSARIMIASDVLARGIDIQTISLVLNFDFPDNRENYIHRIGRSGRFGRKGTAINFITSRDVRLVQDVERYYKTKIPEMPHNYKELL